MAYELPKRLLCGKCGMSFPIRDVRATAKNKARCSEPGCGRPHCDGYYQRKDGPVVRIFMTPAQAREWLDSR